MSLVYPAVRRAKPQPRSRRLAADLAGGLAFAAALSAFPLSMGWAQWAEVEALRAEWTVAGPACPTVEAIAPWARGRKPPLTHRYGGATFSRSFAAVSCAAIPKAGLWSRGRDYVCQFNNPGAVIVQTDGARVIFQPPVGQRATVSIRDGSASCVVGGRFNL